MQQQIQNSIHNNDDYQLLLPGTDSATGTSTSGSSTATGPGGRNVHLSSTNVSGIFDGKQKIGLTSSYGRDAVNKPNFN